MFLMMGVQKVQDNGCGAGIYSKVVFGGVDFSSRLHSFSLVFVLILVLQREIPITKLAAEQHGRNA